MCRLGFLSAVALLVASSQLIAATEPSSPDPCADAPTICEMNQCYAKQQKIADDEVSNTWQALLLRFDELEKLSPEDKTSIDELETQKQVLLESQSAWEVFRKDQCEFEATFYATGSARVPIYRSFTLLQTLCRVEQLNEALKFINTAFGQRK